MYRGQPINSFKGHHLISTSGQCPPQSRKCNRSNRVIHHSDSEFVRGRSQAHTKRAWLGRGGDKLAAVADNATEFKYCAIASVRPYGNPELPECAASDDLEVVFGECSRMWEALFLLFCFYWGFVREFDKVTKEIIRRNFAKDWLSQLRSSLEY